MRILLFGTLSAILPDMGILDRDKQRIVAIDAGSPAERAKICVGDCLLGINGQPVLDVIDYEYLTAESTLRLDIEKTDGTVRHIVIRKRDDEPLGLSFATSLMSPVRACHNHCLFCFIDQMPKGVRSSLAFKDDDWRLSFIMGNYVTLTNVSDAEFDRILARHVGPLYVSVHATDPDVRVRMMRNPTAARILERLTALKEAGLRFHAQIVLCPGENDGAILEKTVSDLAALAPEAQSVAIVPVGLTRFREGLYPLRRHTADEARNLIAEVERWQSDFQRRLNTSFVFLSDEWYIRAGLPLPAATHYEEYPQIENGVGLLRLFESDMLDALRDAVPRKSTRRFFAAGGSAAAPFMRQLFTRLQPFGVEITNYAVPNRYFGEQIDVSGLVTGQDLVSALSHQMDGSPLLIPRNMLREREDVFLDGMTLKEASDALRAPILPVRDGEELIDITVRSN